MDLNSYQKKATETAVFTDAYYPFASLMIEAAEFADIVTKPWLRQDNVKPDRNKLISEAGDVLWNLANALDIVNIKLQEVAEYNLHKLASRQQRGVLKGSGGER